MGLFLGGLVWFLTDQSFIQQYKPIGLLAKAADEGKIAPLDSSTHTYAGKNTKPTASGIPSK